MRAVHAGSASGAAAERGRATASTLSSQLDGFLAAAEVQASRSARALIVPHAGYSYSGPTAAYGYKAVDTRALCVPACREPGARRPGGRAKRLTEGTTALAA